LRNLEAISYGIQKPILRPLIGMDKTEIMALARQIGTYDASIEGAHACPFLPDHPLTQADMAYLVQLLDLFDETTPAGKSGVPLPAQDGESRG
jgi:thiamine biosynthesis protein ThiI